MAAGPIWGSGGAREIRPTPIPPDAHYNLGNALAAEGKKSEARTEFLKALAANPSHAGARMALDNLGKVE